MEHFFTDITLINTLLNSRTRFNSFNMCVIRKCCLESLSIYLGQESEVRSLKLKGKNTF